MRTTWASLVGKPKMEVSASKQDPLMTKESVAGKESKTSAVWAAAICPGAC